ncbi:unnamed protein product [Paramecium sonneborni]|uniref:Uncharacterized protein n=1 Tax=Paramecium sonneborni TaxID=65129 RepID=A0A8S1MER5_9CILI|nr:unnamed protein product [Paramecium sonneborni]
MKPKNIIPLFLNQKIDDIRSQNVRRRINSISEGKSQIGMIYNYIETLAQHLKVIKEYKKQTFVGQSLQIIQSRSRKLLS